MSVERSIVIAAPPERVWAALAEPEQLAQWFLPPMGAQLQRADDGTLTVLMGPITVDLAVMDGL